MRVFSRMKAVLFAFAMAIAGLLPAVSHAALDAAVTTGIITAQIDLVALLSAMTAAGIVVFVARIIYRYFKLR